MKLIFERSRPGRGSVLLPPCDVPEVTYDAGLLRAEAPRLPEIAESRPGTALHGAGQADPRGERRVLSPGLLHHEVQPQDQRGDRGPARLHPAPPPPAGGDRRRGPWKCCTRPSSCLCEITGMDGMSFQPAAGAHGEYTGLLLITANTTSPGGTRARTKILVPDSAHGTNPASAAMAGFQVVSTSPPTPRAAGGSGRPARRPWGRTPPASCSPTPTPWASLTPISWRSPRSSTTPAACATTTGPTSTPSWAIVRPGDMGFDCVHLNLHKTFSTPHGGGGPGSGPVGCKAMLEPFLPGPPGAEGGGELFPVHPRPDHGPGAAASTATSWWW